MKRKWCLPCTYRVAQWWRTDYSTSPQFFSKRLTSTGWLGSSVSKYWQWSICTDPVSDFIFSSGFSYWSESVAEQFVGNDLSQSLTKASIPQEQDFEMSVSWKWSTKCANQSYLIFCFHTSLIWKEQFTPSDQSSLALEMVQILLLRNRGFGWGPREVTSNKLFRNWLTSIRKAWRKDEVTDGISTDASLSVLWNTWPQPPCACRAFAEKLAKNHFAGAEIGIDGE